MKILVTRFCNEIGGVEIYSRNLVQAMGKYCPDNKIYLLTNFNKLAQDINNAGGEAKTLPIFSEEIGTRRGLVRFLLASPKYYFYLLKAIIYLRFKKGLKTALFQGTTEKLTLSPILKLLGMKVLWLEHGPFFKTGRAKEIEILYRLKSHFVNKIITVSEDARNNLIKGGISPKKTLCIPNGIDADYFLPLTKSQKQEARSKLGIGEKDLIIGFVGRICQEKGIEELLSVAKSLPDSRFILVGEGPMRQKAMKSGCACPGFLDDVRSYLGIFDIFYFPTRHHEGLSASVQQAMAMGIPVVARDIGGNKELVDEETGYLYKGDSLEAIEKLLKNEKRRIKIGKAARRKIIVHFNSQKWIEKMYEAFSFGYHSDL